MNNIEKEISNFNDILEKQTKLYFSYLSELTSNNNMFFGSNFILDILTNIYKNPEKIIDYQKKAYQAQNELFNQTITRFSSDKLEENKAADKRFKHELWEKNIFFNYLKEYYFLNSNLLSNFADNLSSDIKEEEQKKLKFLINQIIEATCPTNFALSNPEVLEKVVETNGENLLNGYKNFLQDIENTEGPLNISTVNKDNFKLGENIANTKGKIIFQNKLLQIICYEAVTKEEYEIPIFIISPWINKYYILDLNEKKSFVSWLTRQGYRVYITSWANPDESFRDIGFEDYMLQGVIEPIEYIIKATKIEKVNIIGYCIGGTLAACSAAYLKKKNKELFNSLTLMTTLLDFENAGDMSLFMDEETISKIEKYMEPKGYLDGESMRLLFSMLKPNDMIWSFYINNYLMGKEPGSFDLLYWNSDSTRMPFKMHSFYLRNMYKDNLLKNPNAISLAGEPIDISTITIPSYLISTLEDHIAPWKCTFKNLKLLKNAQFVLGGSGHVAGVVNPPEAEKYCYWTNESNINLPDEWLASAREFKGSWWNNWNEWAASLSGKKVPAFKIEAKFKVIEDAPGSYALGIKHCFI